MKTIIVNKQHRDSVLQQPVMISHCNRLITEDTAIYDSNGKLIAVYLRFLKDTDDLLWGCQEIDSIMLDHKRTGGLRSRSALAGFMPANGRRLAACHETSVGIKFPKANEIIMRYGQELDQMYKEVASGYYSKHKYIIEHGQGNKVIHKDYFLKDTLFTSAIINKDSALAYHRDRGNIKGVMSAMIVLKQGVSGGNLILPEYDLGFATDDRSVLFFDGQEIIHGVTKIHKQRLKAYRYSIVFYTLQNLWNCLPIKQELEKFMNKPLNNGKWKL